jgi:mitogen-activated protein kinase kinase kinase 1
LQPANIFTVLGENGEIRSLAIGDFDQAKVLSDRNQPAVTCVGTPAFVAPEVLNSLNEREYGKPADVYSLGICIYEMLTLQRPFIDVPMLSLASMVIAGARPELPATLPADTKPIVAVFLQCTEVDPDDRPSLYDVKKSLFFDFFG